MNEPWYEVVDGATSLTQGDLVFSCPLLTWDPTKLPQVSGEQEAEVLKRGVTESLCKFVT